MKERPFLLLCRWLILSGVAFGGFSLNAQNLRCKNSPTGKWIQLDTILIDPNSIQTSAEFQFDATNQSIFLTKKKVDTAQICYRVLSPLLTKAYQNRKPTAYDSERVEEILQQNVPIEKESLFETGGKVEKMGAISRGISFGNRQNLVVNSMLNLQMNGKLSDKLNVAAVITDQNIPYQPEGNTQQIRDFDNVFIRLYNDQFHITAGDIVLRNDSSNYFLKYFKNIQGLQAGYQWKHQNWQTRVQASGAFSKGKFYSAVIKPIDGVSGPYKLRGANGDRFIIILANSEKVFLNGKKLERGFDRDYSIDYNLGEITFNNHILITQFSVIRVDYEYAEQRYSRSNLAFSHESRNKNVRIRTRFYREKDNPNNVFGLKISDKSLSELAAIGDTVRQAFVTNFDTVAYDPNQIQYAQIDTTDANGNTYRIYQYSRNATEKLYRPIFNEVGANRGFYRLSSKVVNGKLYEWVAPKNGILQGNYQAGAFVPPPNSRMMTTVGVEVNLSKYETFSQEIAYSHTDKNLYSPLQDLDNGGIAMYGRLQSEGRPSFLRKYQWKSSISTEWDASNFTYIDRYRPILFDRNWGIAADSIPKTVRDWMLFSSIGLVKNVDNLVEISVDNRSRAKQLEGQKYGLNWNQQLGKFFLHSQHSLLSVFTASQNNQWLKSRSTLSYRSFWDKIMTGYTFEIDENEQKTLADSVIASQMHYRSHEFFIANGDSTKANYRLSYTLRADQTPQKGQMTDYLDSKTFNANYSINGKTGFVQFNANHRMQTNQLTKKTEEYVNGRINWKTHLFNQHVTNQFTYGSGNGRELKRSFVFLRVKAGQGTHTWRDENGDGVQDLSEFYEAINPDERNFAKIYTPTDEYITVFQTNYLHNINIKAPRNWSQQTGLFGKLSKTSLSFTQNTQFKTTSSDLSNRLIPFNISEENDELKSLNERLRATFFYNRNRRGLAMDVSFLTTRNKQLLSQGSTLSQKKEWQANIKTDLSAAYMLRFSGKKGETSSQSSFLTDRSFLIHFFSFSPQLIWQPNNEFRIKTSYTYDQKNVLSVGRTEANKVTVSLALQKRSKGTLRAEYVLTQLRSPIDQSNYLAYILLEGKQKGINHNWQLTWQRRLTKGLQLNLTYFGRKSPNIKTIHTGNVQVTAFF